MPRQEVTFTLTDETEGLILGVAYPDVAYRDALDVTLSVAMAYGVQRTGDDRSKEAGERRSVSLPAAVGRYVGVVASTIMG